MPLEKIDLRECEIHVWKGLMAEGEAASETPAQWLSVEEKERAGRYIGETVRLSFVHWRCALRWVLGRYLGVEPDAVALDSGPRGKPCLAGAGSRLRFNLSHSGRAGVIAVCLDHEIGVDIELVRPVADLTGIANRYFTRKEIEILMETDPLERNRFFFTVWTRKEAVLKASGQGFGLPANRLDTTRSPVTTDLGEHQEVWHLHDLNLWPDQAGCVAVPFSGAKIRILALPQPEHWSRKG